MAGTEGDYLIVLEDLLPMELQFLHKANKEMYPPSCYSAFVLPDGAWQGLKEQNHETLYLSAEEVEEAHGKGYIKRDGVWAPANKTIGKVWEGTDNFPGLAREIINVREYAALVSESAVPPVGSSAPFSDSMLNVYFDLRIRNQEPSMTLWLVVPMERCSSIYGNVSLNSTCYTLVGRVSRTR